MREFFTEDRGLDVPRAGDMTGFDPAGGPAGLGQSLGGGGRYPLEGRHVCPFCGAVNETMEGPCPNCTMTNTAETRKATKSRIGPWYVLQSRNPAAPGMRYETLLGFVRKGRVKARSIVRGPTTHQLWRFACQVKGLSREFGLCYSCGGSIERDAQLCPQCNRLQDTPADPDVFLEGQPTPAAQDSVAPPVASKSASPAEALQEAHQGPIFKELKLPPLTEVPPAAPPPAARPPVPAPAPAPGAGSGAQPPFPAAAPSTAYAPHTLQAVPPAAPAAPAAPAHAGQNPAGGRPPRRNANDVFLSAKDLAAAFQLGFDGDADADAEAAHQRGAAWGAGESAAQPARAHRRPRRKRRVGRVILLALVLGVGGFAAYLALDVNARQRVFQWAEAHYMTLTGANLYPDLNRRGSTDGSATASAPRVPVPVPEPAGNSSPAEASLGATAASATRADPRSPVLPPPAPVAAEPPAARVPAPAPAPGSIPAAESARAAATPPTTRSAPPAATAPASVTPTGRQATGVLPPAPRPQQDVGAGSATQPARPAAPSQAPEPTRLSIEEARRRSGQLWKEALNAEEDNDYRKAKDLYEQMMKLPREVWYQGIEGRLRFAKEMLGEK